MRHVLGRRTVVAVALITLLPLAACGGKKKEATGTTPSTGAPAHAAVDVDGKAHVVGTLTQMTAARASIDPIQTPFTFNVANVGRGGLDLPAALVNGTNTAIIWSGGRPLPVTGSCSLDTGPVNLTVDGGGAHLSLDGEVRALTPGTCHFGSSVAVGTHGLSEPQDSVDFTLPKSGDFTTSGDVTVTAPAPNRYEGRDGLLALTGPMHVITETDEFDSPSLALQTGTWVVKITAIGSTLHVVADLEGKMAIGKK